MNEPQLRTLKHSAPFGPLGPVLCAPVGFVAGTYPVVLALAQHLDSTFLPSVSEASQLTAEQRGSSEQWLLWDDTITKDPTVESSHAEWTAHGLAGGCALRLGGYARGGGSYELVATGPVPEVDEVVQAWSSLIERGTGVRAQHAFDALARAVFPRLVTLTHTHPIWPHDRLLCEPLGFANGVYPIVRLLAQHLDPSFDPPDTVLFKEDEYTSAYGCGGGHSFEKRGDAKRWLSWSDVITEHSSSDTSDGEWKAYGLLGGCKLVVGRDDGGAASYDLSVTAPPQLAKEVVAVWTALVEREPSVTVEDARTELLRVVALREPA